MRRARSAEAGFMMVEALEALTLAAIVGAGVMAALSSANARSAEAQTRSLALRQAEALIAEAEHPGPDQSLPTKGSIASHGLTWVRTIEPLGEDRPMLETIKVSVRWTARHREGETHLEAYRVKPAA